MGELKLKAPIARHLKTLAKAGLINAKRFLEVKNELPKFANIFDVLNFLIDEKVIDEKALLEFYSKRYKLPIVNLKEIQIDDAIKKVVRVQVCRRHLLIPIKMDNIYITVATFFPMNLTAHDELVAATGRRVKWVLATRQDILEKIDEYYFATSGGEIQHIANELAGEPASPEQLVDDIVLQDVVVLDNPSAPPVVKLVNLIISDAIAQRASDIHIEPTETNVVVRYRIDGTLKEVATLNKDLHSSIVSRIKIMAQLDIAERNKPQDGKARVKKTKDSEITDLRVSTIPTMFGEKVVIRILDESSINRTLEDLGHPDYITSRFKLLLKRPHGVIIVTGPTGSGKSTTLYVALRMLATGDVNIITVEDPVEYHLDNINQVGIDSRKGLTFAAALRSILRQDPDVIMVGEIRDKETAEIAMEAAQTGHLVLTTLHTNDAASAVTRLLELGVPGYLIQSSLIGVLAQRLIRRLCPKCKKKQPISDEERQILETCKGLELKETWVPVGCNYCSKIGYRGRVAIGELLVMSDSIREAIAEGATDLEIRRRAIQDGMVPMEITAYSLVVQGITSLTEAFKIAGPCNVLEVPPEVLALTPLAKYAVSEESRKRPKIVLSMEPKSPTSQPQPSAESSQSAPEVQPRQQPSPPQAEATQAVAVQPQPTNVYQFPTQAQSQPQSQSQVQPITGTNFQPTSQPQSQQPVPPILGADVSIVEEPASAAVPISEDGTPPLNDPKWVESYIKSKVIDAPIKSTLPGTERPKLLVVDDDYFVRETIARAFASEFNVRVAKDGVEALKMMQVDLPDVVLLDIRMPRMSGFEVLQMIRLNPNWDHVKVIILTAETAREDELLGMHLGADDFIRKPIDIEILKARIKAVLRRR